jgi:hypothetical protein
MVFYLDCGDFAADASVRRGNGMSRGLSGRHCRSTSLFDPYPFDAYGVNSLETHLSAELNPECGVTLRIKR